MANKHTFNKFNGNINNTISANHNIWVDDTKLMYADDTGKNFAIGKLIERLETVEKKLAILEDPTPEQLEQNKMLEDAYKKYKFIEGLSEGKDDNNG